jgi:hypothetical protein
LPEISDLHGGWDGSHKLRTLADICFPPFFKRSSDHQWEEILEFTIKNLGWIVESSISLDIYFNFLSTDYT